MVLYVSWKSSFISTQFFFLNLYGWVSVLLLSNKFIVFWYSVTKLWYIIFVSSYQYFVVSFLETYICHLVFFYQMLTFNCLWTILREGLETFVLLSTILLPIESFQKLLFLEAVLSASIADFWTKSRRF